MHNHVTEKNQFPCKSITFALTKGLEKRETKIQGQRNSHNNRGILRPTLKSKTIKNRNDLNVSQLDSHTQETIAFDSKLNRCVSKKQVQIMHEWGLTNPATAKVVTMCTQEPHF